MKRLIAVLLASLMVFAACGDDDSGAASDCDDLVDQGLQLFQDALDAMGDMSLEDLADSGADTPPALQDLETRGEQLEAEADRLGCSDAELEAGLAARIDEVEATGPIAELILEGIKEEIESGSFFSE